MRASHRAILFVRMFSRIPAPFHSTGVESRVESRSKRHNCMSWTHENSSLYTRKAEEVRSKEPSALTSDHLVLVFESDAESASVHPSSLILVGNVLK